MRSLISSCGGLPFVRAAESSSLSRSMSSSACDSRTSMSRLESSADRIAMRRPARVSSTCLRL